MTAKGLRVEFPVPKRRDRRRKRPDPAEPVPRIARLLALAWKWELAVRRGEVKDCAEIARLMGLTRARVTQVCQLTMLAPALQEVLLSASSGSHPASEQKLRPLCFQAAWDTQRSAFRCRTTFTSLVPGPP